MEDTRHVQLFDNGIAVVDLIGPIFPRANMMTMSGGVSVSQFTQDLMRAYNHPDVKGVVLNIDSPGGDVRGIGDAAKVINMIAKKGKKPLQAFASGYMASAAYYIASAVGQGNIIATESGIVGSIGVVSTLQRKDEKTIEIVSSQSPLKRPDPATDAGRALAQQMVDDLGAIFVKDVATYRGVGQDKVLADYGQGATFVAPRALKQGLVDGIGTLDSVVENMGTSPIKTRRPSYKAVEGTGVSAILQFTEEENMGFADFINRFKASTDTMEDDENTEQAQETTAGEESETALAVVEGQEEPTTEASDVAAVAGITLPSRAEMEDLHSASAELFAHQMVTDSRIVPALGAYAASDLLNAMTDDAIHQGSVNFIDENGLLASGTREAAVRARYKAMPKHTLTQKAVAGVKEGTVEAKVLAEGPLETASDQPTTEARRKELLSMSSQGQAVLDARK